MRRARRTLTLSLRLRALCWARDRGICQRCGLDCTAAHRWFEALYRERPRVARLTAATLGFRWGRSFWQSHHVMAYCDGGKHTKENLITLCCSCHLTITNQQAAERARRRKAQPRLSLPYTSGSVYGSAKQSQSKKKRREQNRMPQAPKKEYDIAEEGSHILTLVSVEEARIKSLYPDGKGDPGTSGVWYWNFESNLLDEWENNQKLRHMTQPELTPNNNLTKFWKQLVPKTDNRPTVFEDIDGNTDPLIGKKWAAEVVHETKGDKTYANIKFIKPYVRPAAVAAAKPKPKVVAQSDDPDAPGYVEPQSDDPDAPGYVADDPFTKE